MQIKGSFGTSYAVYNELIIVIVTRYVVTIMLKCAGTKQRFDDRTAKLSSEIII